MAVELILGGARSGKTAFAQNRALALEGTVTYVATARSGDLEMRERIRLHRQSRPSHWGLIEEPVHLARVLGDHATCGTVLVVDCLTLWLTNLLSIPEDPDALEREKGLLLQLLPHVPGTVLLVNNETGLGIVPMGSLSRRFSDENGWLNQALAQMCRRVTLMVAGLPLELKKD
ncbi:MAG: bifunctional adenosylcobinamide kinase/adenosylcobinamide-phosphate guanylyltransferase [Magnetococcales bacterium]|nr:bifunctional adenosylcobinamide kinase/adenosylcobinamide-phosphate guanylyltransferase [Magnetococcales bacterium]